MYCTSGKGWGVGGQTQYAIQLCAIPETVEEGEVNEYRGYDYDGPRDRYRAVSGVQSVREGRKQGWHLEHQWETMA